MPTVVITGASRGLGLALAQTFRRAEWQVIGTSRTRAHWTSALKAFPSKKGVSFHAFDLTSEPRVKSFAARFKGKRIDLLINNAGYGGGYLRVEKTALAEYRKLMDANLLSAFLMCKHFIPILRQQKGGCIFNISSMAGLRAVPGVAVYSAAKFGLRALSQAVAKENQEVPIKCLTVCPGGMNTDMRARIFGQADAERQQSPLFVAQTIYDVYRNKIAVESGGEIVIRHGQVTAIHPCPDA